MNYSRIIAGTMTWGQWGKNFNNKEQIKMMNHCIELGISTFDHADIYGGYTNEADFGKALSESNINREAVQLISKCGIQYLCENRDNKIKHYNYSSDYIVWSVETSLKHLKTDYLDLFLLHRPSPLMHPEEIAKAISKLKKEGKIKSFGVSNFTPSQVDLISTKNEVEVNQVEFSVTQPNAMYDGTLDQMLKDNMTPMAWSPLGALFKETTKQTTRIKTQLQDLASVYNATEDQLILAWLLKHPANIHPVIGTTQKKRITDAVKALSIDLDLEDWFLILAASQGHKVP